MDTYTTDRMRHLKAPFTLRTEIPMPAMSFCTAY